MTPEESEKLTTIHAHVTYLRGESEAQDKRITILEHWRTGIVAGCTSVLSALGMYFKIGGGNQ